MDANAPPGIRIAAIPGSVRPGNFTGKALALTVDEIRKHPDIALDVMNPATLNRRNICPRVTLEEMARRGSLSWARFAADR